MRGIPSTGEKKSSYGALTGYLKLFKVKPQPFTTEYTELHRVKTKKKIQIAGI